MARIDMMRPRGEPRSCRFQDHGERLHEKYRYTKPSSSFCCRPDTCLVRPCSEDYYRLRSQLRSVLAQKVRLHDELAKERNRSARNELQLAQMKSQLSHVEEKNFKLSEANRNLKLEMDKWKKLYEYSQELNHENQILLRKIKTLLRDLQQEKAAHENDVTMLSANVKKSEEACKAVKMKLKILRNAFSKLHTQYQNVMKIMPERISRREHRKALEHMQGIIHELNKKSKSVVLLQEAHLEAQNKTKRNLVGKLSDAIATIQTLEEENDIMQRTNRKAREKISKLYRDIEWAKDKDVCPCDGPAFCSDKAISCLKRKLSSCEKMLTKLDCQTSSKERNSYLQKRENENVIFSLRSVLDETQEQLSKLEDNSISSRGVPDDYDLEVIRSEGKLRRAVRRFRTAQQKLDKIRHQLSSP